MEVARTFEKKNDAGAFRPRYRHKLGEYRMISRSMAVLCALVLTALALHSDNIWAGSSVERNSNIVGRTLPGYYRGIPGMQDNEPSCALNPLLARNVVCAWNASGGSDDPAGPGDTAIRMSESLDGGVTFINRYINGTSLNPATSLNVQFMADPVTMENSRKATSISMMVKPLPALSSASDWLSMPSTFALPGTLMSLLGT